MSWFAENHMHIYSFKSMHKSETLYLDNLVYWHIVSIDEDTQVLKVVCDSLTKIQKDSNSKQHFVATKCY
jgi:hypothetical protein